MPLTLASQSPRRREILAQAGIAYQVRPPGIEERHRAGETPADYVRRLAHDKAAAVVISADEYVLAADTVVVVDEQILEKPASAEDAARMLRVLSGRAHSVLTGVCLLHGGQVWNEVATTRVWFNRLSDEEIASYCATPEPLDKAGAYAIQGLASRYISRIDGCYFNVVGLPVSLVYQLLCAAGYNWARPA